MSTTIRWSVEIAAPSRSISAVNVGLQSGLTSSEVRHRLETLGPNAMPDTSMHPLRMAIETFWALVPWMLEAAIARHLTLTRMSRLLPNNNDDPAKGGSYRVPLPDLSISS